ncbi:hypothetical protein [Amphritea balenae]|uniref:Uncharacterized protein n=1 Tax=Amphritea balenae TaxID=452629 RepID=A0A3P1ST50_9GAMM|nr:hypothetical protein [Amphritea balenae]RRD00367.1 hypothetical protein EHS89_04525 [Amphritea balenae]
MNRLVLLGFLSTLTLAGCNAANVQPQSSDQGAVSVQNTVPESSEAVNAEHNAQFDKLNGRITLMQEQFLELKIQNTAVAERVQLLLTQFQVLAQQIKSGSGPVEVDGQETDLSDMMQRLDQQLIELQQIAPELGGGDPFKLATCYTAKGKWKLIRYNRFTGESWISADNSWQPLDEEFTPQLSSYEVQLLRANGDVKGYVAARIDQNTGDTWWLNNDTWVKYQQ